MLKLSKKTDYGLMAIQYLTTRTGEGNTSVRQIATEFNAPLELLAKVLQKLAKKGLVTSQNGPRGGYILAKPPSQISVIDVIEAIEGPVRMTQCYTETGGHDGINPCLQFEHCQIRTPIEKIQAGIVRFLDSMTMTQMSQISQDPEGDIPPSLTTKMFLTSPGRN